MKTITKILFTLVLFTGITNAQCGREGSFIPIADPIDYPIEGGTTLNFETNGTKQVLFGDDFVTVQGIELRVYLSKTEFIEAGQNIEISTEPLQDDDGGMDMGSPITGSRTFDVPVGVDINDYDFVLVQCVVADMLWGRSTLGEASGAGCDVLSIEDSTFTNFSLTPNPASEILSIEGIQGEITELRIFDTTGKNVMSKVGAANTLDISSLTSGFYFVSVIANDKRSTKKLLVQ